MPQFWWVIGGLTWRSQFPIDPFQQSYTCGLINVFAWVAIAAGVGIIIPQIVVAPIIYYDASYVPKTWHIFLIYQAASAFCLVHNIFTLRRTMWIFDLICKWRVLMNAAI